MAFRGKFLLQRSTEVLGKYTLQSQEWPDAVAEELAPGENAVEDEDLAGAPTDREEGIALEESFDSAGSEGVEPATTLGLTAEELAKVDSVLQELRDSEAESREASRLDWEEAGSESSPLEEAVTPSEESSDSPGPEECGSELDEKMAKIDEYLAEYREKVRAGALSQPKTVNPSTSERGVDDLFRDFFDAEAKRRGELELKERDAMGVETPPFKEEGRIEEDEVLVVESDAPPLKDTEVESLTEAIRVAEGAVLSPESTRTEREGDWRDATEVEDRGPSGAEVRHQELSGTEAGKGPVPGGVESAVDLSKEITPEGELTLKDIDAQERLIFPSESSIAPVKEEPEWSSSGPAVMREAQEFVYESIRLATESRFPSISRGESLVDRMLESIEEDSGLLKAAMDREQRYSVSAHCVNVAILSLMMASTLGCGYRRQRRIGLAALLHEVGVARLPARLIYKEGGVGELEMRALRNRPQLSSQALQNLGSAYSWMAEVVGQVYEREDGTGSPLGLTGDEIYEEARIIGAADLFEACIHQRPYRKAITGYQALFELTTHQAKTFPDRIVKALIRSFSLYPYNEKVVLSNGVRGRVIEINRENLSRPVVEVLFEANGDPAKERKVVDLAQNSSLHVVKAVAGFDVSG